MRTGERGFTYLWLLFVVAAGGAVLATAGQRWSGVTQSDRERELIFRGEQIALAISAYRTAEGAGVARWPSGWDELLEDRRGPSLRRHLRRAYADPFTGKPDWVPIVDADGRWRGVHSRSSAPARLVREATEGAAASRPRHVGEHRFLANDPAAAASPLTPAKAKGVTTEETE